MLLNQVIFVPGLLLNPALTDPLSPWKPVTRDGQPLIHQILSYWCQEYESSLSNETLVQYVKELTQLVQMKQDSVALAQVQYLSQPFCCHIF